MSYEVIAIPNFVKVFKKLLIKYPSLKEDLLKIIQILEIDPTTGKFIGNNCYKIRMAITSKGKGKSGGARIITCVKVLEKNVYLLTIYDKSEKENINIKELYQLLKHIK